MLANRLAARFDVTIVTLANAPVFYELEPEVEVCSPPSQVTGKGVVIKSLLLLAYLVKTIRSSKPRAALIFGEDIGGPLCFISSVLRVPRILVFNRATPRRSLEKRNGLLNPIFYRFADAVVLQTDAARKILKSRYRGCHFEVIPNPIEVPVSVPPLLARERIIVNVGSIGRLKNQDALIRVFAGLHERFDWRLVFVGDGPGRRELENLAQSLGLTEAVNFLGERSDVGEILQSAQVFAFTSLSEGFPNALAEGLAAGCACISYDCPTGPEELIENGRNGLLIEVGDEGAYREGLEALLADASIRERLSTQARKDIRRFETSRILPRFEELALDG